MAPGSTTDPDWWSTLGALLRANGAWRNGLPSRSPSTAAIHDIDDTRGFVSRVKDLGCKIAIDDFGSRYTSFRNLRKLGVDILKIDGAFVQNLMRAASLLAEWGCDYLQGALVGLATVERPWGDAVQVDRRKTART